MLDVIGNNLSNQKCKYFPQETKGATVYIFKMNYKKQNILFTSKIPICTVNSNFDTSTLHLPLAHVSSPIYNIIHFSPLITTIKKNKIVSLLFNVGSTIFTNSSSSLFIPMSLHLCYNIYLF